MPSSDKDAGQNLQIYRYSRKRSEAFFLEQQAFRFDQFFNNKKIKKTIKKVKKPLNRNLYAKVGQSRPK